LTSAAEFDSATGGVNRDAGLYPIIKFITAGGVRATPDPQLRALFESKVSRTT
jgi:proteasome beta subunit